MRSERESEKLEDEGSIPSRPTSGTKMVAIDTVTNDICLELVLSRQYARMAESADAADLFSSQSEVRSSLTLSTKNPLSVRTYGFKSRFGHHSKARFLPRKPW